MRSLMATDHAPSHQTHVGLPLLAALGDRRLTGFTRVAGTSALATAAGFSGRRSESDLETRRRYENLQYLLDCIASDVEGKQKPAEPIHEPVKATASPKAAVY